MTAIAARDLQQCLTQRAEARARRSRWEKEKNLLKLRNGTITQAEIDESDRIRAEIRAAGGPPDQIWEYAYTLAPGYVSSTDESDMEEGRDKFATPPPSPRDPNLPDLSLRAWYKVYWNMVMSKIQDPTRIGFDKYETWKALMLDEIKEKEQSSKKMPDHPDKVSVSRSKGMLARRYVFRSWLSLTSCVDSTTLSVTRSRSKKDATFYELDGNGKTSHRILSSSIARPKSAIQTTKARRISKQTHRALRLNNETG